MDHHVSAKLNQLVKSGVRFYASSPAALRAKWPVCWPYTSTTHGCTLLAKQSNVVECHPSSISVLSVTMLRVYLMYLIAADKSQFCGRTEDLYTVVILAADGCGVDRNQPQKYFRCMSWY